MITCPWCGTNYTEFQTNCRNCGGPLPLPRPVIEENEEALVLPPPAPRPIANSFVWKLLMPDALFIVGIIFSTLGGIFSVVGLALTLALVTILVGIPFLLLGMAFFGSGLAAAIWRYQSARKTVQVLQVGQVARGEITSVEQNYNVRVNGRHPWLIRYRFGALGKQYEGQVSTMNRPGASLREGNPVYVLYLAESPAQNAIYPHP